MDSYFPALKEAAILLQGDATPHVGFAMRVRAVLTAIAMATLLRCGLVSGQQAAPRFEEFPVAAMFDVTPAPVILVSARARRFRTVLTTQAKERPNFAGQYRVATWGCGSDCHAFAIIDAKTGRCPQ